MRNNTTLKYRLAQFLQHLDIGQAKFAETISVSKGFANNVGDSIRADNLDKISATYPELNITWLLTGEGEMLKTEQPSQSTLPDTSTNDRLLSIIESQQRMLESQQRTIENLTNK